MKFDRDNPFPLLSYQIYFWETSSLFCVTGPKILIIIFFLSSDFLFSLSLPAQHANIWGGWRLAQGVGGREMPIRMKYILPSTKGVVDLWYNNGHLLPRTGHKLIILSIIYYLLSIISTNIYFYKKAQMLKKQIIFVALHS